MCYALHMKILLLLFITSVLAVGCNSTEAPSAPDNSGTSNPVAAPQEQAQRLNFASLNATFSFTGEIEKSWKTEYIPQIEAINIYDSSLPGTSLEQSQIFIRYFKASKFLTLTTVDILAQESLTINGHAAVRYEIKKKSGVPSFPYQPAWRNEQHIVTDIRSSTDSPSLFYVIAKAPTVPEDTYQQFLQSLELQ
jgi:hypothetical protein